MATVESRDRKFVPIGEAKSKGEHMILEAWGPTHLELHSKLKCTSNHRISFLLKNDKERERQFCANSFLLRTSILLISPPFPLPTRMTSPNFAACI